MKFSPRTRLFLIALILLLALPALSAMHVSDDGSRVDMDAPDYSAKLPIVYNSKYNITFMGMEKLHPFDSTKYAHVFQGLRQKAKIKKEDIIKAEKPDEDVISAAHSPRYLQSIQNSAVLAEIAELHTIAVLPDRMAWNLLADRMLYQAGGSIMAAQAALQHGWAINLGGGFHHASYDNGEGFCVFADISMLVRAMREHADVKKVMIIDLDAHQGNGHGADFGDDPDVYILDAYNAEIYPQDTAAEKGIDLAIKLESGEIPADFLPRVKDALTKAFAEFSPDLVVYVAGTDILAGDPLGQMAITPEAVIERDALVFAHSIANDAPIVMLLGGGYQKSSADVITSSILNLREQFKLF